MNPADEQKVKSEFWQKLARNLARVPFAEEAVAAWYCAFDPITPLKDKGILLGALVYFILPFDLVPDFILGLGFTDDLAVLMTAITLVKSHITQNHRDKAKAVLVQVKQGSVPNGSQ